MKLITTTEIMKLFNTPCSVFLIVSLTCSSFVSLLHSQATTKSITFAVRNGKQTVIRYGTDCINALRQPKNLRFIIIACCAIAIGSYSLFYKAKKDRIKSVPLPHKETTTESLSLIDPTQQLVELIKQTPVNLDRIKTLLSQPGINVNYKDQENRTLLHLAIPPSPYIVHKELIELLLEHNVPVNEQDSCLNTPLHSLILLQNKPDIEIIKLLRDHHASICSQNLSGKTPLATARELKHRNITKCLMCYRPKNYIKK